MKRLLYLMVLSVGLFMVACSSGSSDSNSSNDTKVEETAKKESSQKAKAEKKEAKKEKKEKAQVLRLTGNDKMQYNKTKLTVKAGVPVKLVLKNIGKMPASAMSHDIVILTKGSDYKKFGTAVAKAKELQNLDDAMKSKIIAHSKMLGPGEADVITFTLEEPGTYPFLCTFPAHFYTMNGTIVAE